MLFIGLTFVSLVPATAGVPQTNDFMKYWAASHLLAHRQNPYDSERLSAVQARIASGVAIAPGDVVEAWNPPWLIVALLPYGLLPFERAATFWMFTSVCLVVLALFRTWQMLGSSDDLRGFSFAIAAGFLCANTVWMLRIGQVSSIVLACVVLTAWWLRRGQDRLGGAAILMLTIKPHVTYLVLATLFLWMVRHRRWRVAEGAILLAVATSVVAWALFPGVAGAYLHRVGRLPYQELYFSTLGSLLSWHFGFPGWVRFMGILTLPLCWPLSRCLESRRSLSTFNIALVTSVPFAPYGFNFDHVVLFPAVAEWIGWMRRGELPLPWRWITGVGLATVYGVLLRLVTRRLPYTWFALPAVAFTAVYLLAWRARRVHSPDA